ncbi:MAG: amidohydrolase family protein [Clostridiales bacterium]|nr:amidohydrolase family protein [Candidatus Blautia equi]
MFGECHAHVIMDAKNYKKAVGLHADGVKDEVIHACFAEYQKRQITFMRDGGDSYGVSRRAKEIAPMYGIDYRSPLFAIHKLHHYGGIVGKGFANMKEYHQLVLEAREGGADFIKIMTTGIMDFDHDGGITGTPLEADEVAEMVHIAHEEGMSVMSHTNGIYGVQAAIRAGVDSIEHGNFQDEETIRMLSESQTVWVPTVVTVKNLLGCGRFSDETIRKIWDGAAENLRLAWKYRVKIALGSDAGAYMVPHGKGIEDEYHAFTEVLGESEEIIRWLEEGEKEIRGRFVR